MVPGVEGGYTLFVPEQKQMSIYDAAMSYQKERAPLVIIGGKEYGTGSSRDWAAKGTLLQGVKAVICESFERIHRSNLVGMGVMPLEFSSGVNRKTLGLKGDEFIDLKAKGELRPGGAFIMTITRADGQSEIVELISRVDTAKEMDYFKNGGILPFVLRKIKAFKE
jgi:aconitate hydratase